MRQELEQAPGSGRPVGQRRLAGQPFEQGYQFAHRRVRGQPAQTGGFLPGIHVAARERREDGEDHAIFVVADGGVQKTIERRCVAVANLRCTFKWLAVVLV
jgi:hypothetical protein